MNNKRNGIILLAFAVPFIVSSAVSIVRGDWKHSVKNDSAVVTQNLYSVEFYTNNNPAEAAFSYDGLEYDSYFELPMDIEPYGSQKFVGWSTSIGGSLLSSNYLKYSDLSTNALIKTLKLYGKYSS